MFGLQNHKAKHTLKINCSIFSVFYAKPIMDELEFRLWSFVPPSIFGGGCFPLASRGYGGLFCCVGFFFLFFCQAVKPKARCSARGYGGVLSSCGGLACFFKVFSRFFGARSTQPRFVSQDTRPSAFFSVAVCSRCRKHMSRRSSETGAWPARARVAFALWCAWRPRSTNFWPCSLGMGASVADLRLGAAGDGACFPRAAVSGGFRHCRLCWLLHFLVFSALCCCVISCF